MMMMQYDDGLYQGSIVKSSESTCTTGSSSSSSNNSNSSSNGAMPGRIVKSKRPAHMSSDTTNDRGHEFSSERHHDTRRWKQHPQLRRTRSEENSGGLFSLPLAWVQRNCELRRRLQLQQEVEEQLRKIAEAERLKRKGEYSTHISSTSEAGGSNGHRFCSLHYNAEPSDQSDEDLRIGTQHLSKSGEGMTAELDLDDDEEDLIPKVRIHPESRLIKLHSNDSIESPRKVDFKTPAYILTPQQMHQIAIHVLPTTIAYCPWRRLYSLSRDGDSFEGCLRIISDVPRSLLVVRTTKGAVFGGYADSPWRPIELGNARFYGSAQTCLFSVKDPEKPLDVMKSQKNILNVYKWSGKNRYIQLCDTSSKMLAFGGGGHDGAFGLCIQDDFQTGSTGPCDTFNNAPLCDQETFEIVDVEFWEFLTGVF